MQCVVIQDKEKPGLYLICRACWLAGNWGWITPTFTETLAEARRVITELAEVGEYGQRDAGRDCEHVKALNSSP